MARTALPRSDLSRVAPASRETTSETPAPSSMVPMISTCFSGSSLPGVPFNPLPIPRNRSMWGLFCNDCETAATGARWPWSLLT